MWQARCLFQWFSSQNAEHFFFLLFNFNPLTTRTHARFGLYWIRDSLSVERVFWILVISEISDFLELNSETKAQDPGIRITLFRTIGITWPTSKEISIILLCSALLEIRAGNKTWYLGCLDSFLWKCYPRKRIHCTCHLVTLNIFHWVKNLRCRLCFLPVRILDGCYFLYSELTKRKK